MKFKTRLTRGQSVKRLWLCCLVPPAIVDEQSCTDVIAAEGDDVTLECHVTGSPAPTVLWYRKSVLVGNGERLRVDNVSRYEADHYQCVADNGVGQAARCQTRLTVQCKITSQSRHFLTLALTD